MNHMEIKSKVTVLREPIEQLSQAYMKELRTHNKTKRVYEVDPYAEVYQFRDNVYGIYTHSLDGMGDPWMYLIIGLEKAMLIDTSFGLGNLHGLVDEITGGMEIVLVNTHASYDHSYGNAGFDRAYCHEYCKPYIEKELTPHLWDYLFDEQDKGKWADFPREDLVPYKPHEIIGVPNGHIFDLGGGYEVELVFLPGHQAGHAGFLDKQNRILFCGDAFISMRVGIGGAKPGMPYPEYATVRAFRDELETLAKRTGEFDNLFPGHFIVDIPSDVVPNMLAVCRSIVEAPDQYDFAEPNRDGVPVMMRYVRGLGTIAYKAATVG